MIPSPVLYRCCSLSGWNFFELNAKPNNDPDAGEMWSDDPVIGVTNLWRSSFQTVTGGATISFQLDKFTRLIVCSSFYCMLPQRIHKIFHNC